MDNDYAPRPGIRPLMHEPNRLWPWVFSQHQVWVDINGSEHEIESMPLDYVSNVIQFCRVRAVWIYVLVETDRYDEETAMLDQEGLLHDLDLVEVRWANWLE